VVAVLRSAPVAFLAADLGADPNQLMHPWQAVIARGGQPVLISTSRREVELARSPGRGGTMSVDVYAADARPRGFAGLVLPGGIVNADRLRTQELAIALVRGFFDAGLPVAAVGHAPWLLIEAGVVRGRKLTSWRSLRTDLQNAGAQWVGDHVVSCQDGPNILLTCRGPGDLPAFCDLFTRQFSGAARPGQRAD
jgi:protease I